MEALGWLLILSLAVAVYWYFRLRRRPISLAHLPERFVILDLETTGLASGKNEIIEIGAIRVNRDSTQHEIYQVLVRPKRKIPKKITELTGITQEMVQAEGVSLRKAYDGLTAFIGDHRLITFNAEFDLGFLHAAASELAYARIQNPVSCALQMSRRAWPGRKSYRLADLARDGNLSSLNTHRAIGDCERALVVYTAASCKLRSAA